MGIPSGYTSGQVVQAVPTGINSALVCVKAETAFTTVSSITADNVFTSAYTNYRIMIRQLGTSNTTTEFRLRVGGVTASATNYIFQRLQGASSSAAASLATGQTYFQILGPNGAFINTYIFELFSPAEASPTGFMTQQIKHDGAYTTVAAEIIYGTHTLSTAYDGFIFAPQGGTVTGTYTVYGYGKAV